jgi:mono/diheme cytochrome c family protein
VTEIPEHLLKRSKERRSAIGGGDAPAPDAGASSASQPAADAPAATTPAVPAATAATPVPAAAPPPAPVRPEVAAAQRRRKIPFWALPVLAALPVWAYVYQGTLEPPPAGESDPLVLGSEVYKPCAACHGADGGGGVGPAMGDVLETWPDYRDHMMWVRLGAPGWPGETYGATAKKKANMPQHPTLSDAELAQVVLYERAQFGGLEPGSEEYLALVEVAEGTKKFADVGLGELSAAAGVPDSALAGPG